MWITAFVMGIVGGLHCACMCSPLAMAVTNFQRPYFVNRIVYNGGRILCYGLLGAFAGVFGSLLSLSGIQNILSLSLGIMLVAIGLLGVQHIRIPLISTLVQTTTTKVRALFSRVLKEKSKLSLAALGMVNGLLPCGLTYLALTYCFTLPNAGDGFLFMILFGAGTLPVMLGFTSILQGLINHFHFRLRHFTTASMIILGLLMIARSADTHVDHSPLNESSEIIICR